MAHKLFVGGLVSTSDEWLREVRDGGGLRSRDNRSGGRQW